MKPKSVKSIGELLKSTEQAQNETRYELLGRLATGLEPFQTTAVEPHEFELFREKFAPRWAAAGAANPKVLAVSKLVPFSLHHELQDMQRQDDRHILAFGQGSSYLNLITRGRPIGADLQTMAIVERRIERAKPAIESAEAQPVEPTKPMTEIVVALQNLEPMDLKPNEKDQLTYLLFPARIAGERLNPQLKESVVNSRRSNLAKKHGDNQLGVTKTTALAIQALHKGYPDASKLSNGPYEPFTAAEQDFLDHKMFQGIPLGSRLAKSIRQKLNTETDLQVLAICLRDELFTVPSAGS